MTEEGWKELHLTWRRDLSSLLEGDQNRLETLLCSVSPPFASWNWVRLEVCYEFLGKMELGSDAMIPSQPHGLYDR